jgi:hypothetical protein
VEVIQTQEHSSVNKELRIAECKQNCLKQYDILKQIEEQEKEQSITKKKAIQILARDMEEVMILQGQEDHIKEICHIICRNLNQLGFRQSMARYPVDVLDAKYKRKVDHLNVLSVPQDLPEEFSIYNMKLLDAIRLLENIEYESLARGDIQDIGERVNKLPKRIYDECEKRKIPMYQATKDYKSPEDKFKERINYPESKPARTIFVEAIERHIEAWQVVLKRVYEEAASPVSQRLYQTDQDLRQCADGLDSMTILLKPITDRKYRKTWLQWYNIVRHGHKWFKHSAGKKYQVKDFEGFFRSLTREQIGFRMTKEGGMTFDKVCRFFPGYFRIYTLWYPQVREPLGAQFSRWLHDKLSERS